MAEQNSRCCDWCIYRLSTPGRPQQPHNTDSWQSPALEVSCDERHRHFQPLMSVRWLVIHLGRALHRHRYRRHERQRQSHAPSVWVPHLHAPPSCQPRPCIHRGDCVWYHTPVFCCQICMDLGGDSGAGAMAMACRRRALIRIQPPSRVPQVTTRLGSR